MSGEPADGAVTWWQDDPARLESERAAMYAVAPALVWQFEGSGRWTGHVPLWPIPRRQPSGVTTLVRHRPFAVEIACLAAHPMIQPLVWPTEINPPVDALGWTEWHLLPNGALCLLQGNSSWDPSALAAELVPKISGWYIEYHLKRAGYITHMTEYGIASDDSLDSLLDDIADEAGGQDDEEDGGHPEEDGEDGEEDGP
jgi:hypothetical protein